MDYPLGLGLFWQKVEVPRGLKPLLSEKKKVKSTGAGGLPYFVTWGIRLVRTRLITKVMKPSV